MEGTGREKGPEQRGGENQEKSEKKEKKSPRKKKAMVGAFGSRKIEEQEIPARGLYAKKRGENPP